MACSTAADRRHQMDRPHAESVRLPTKTYQDRWLTIDPGSWVPDSIDSACWCQRTWAYSLLRRVCQGLNFGA